MPAACGMAYQPSGKALPRSPLPQLSPFYAHPRDRPTPDATTAPGPCHNPGGPGWIPHPSLPAVPCQALTMANAVLVDSLHLAQQMVQSFSLSPSSWGPTIILPPVCRGQTSITPSTPCPGRKEGFLSPPPHSTSPPGTSPVSHRHSMAEQQFCQAPLVGWALGDSQFCTSLSRRIPALHSSPWAPATPWHSKNLAEGKNKVPSVAATLHWS